MQTIQGSRFSQINVDGFELWYQPVYGVVGGDVTHNEILLRWRDANGQVHLPYSFMPKVERQTRRHWLDRYVLQETSKQLAQKPHLHLSVNLSDTIFEDFDILEDLDEMLRKSGIDPAQLNLEITERAISSHYSEAFTFIQALKEIGCSVVLDNFSNEYLTFVQWEKLGVDSVKLDGRLIRSLGNDVAQVRLARSILQTSRTFGQSTVAKSIDAPVASRLIEKMRFDSAQGYHLKPPSQYVCLTTKVDILGVPIDNLSQEELLQELRDGTVFTPNVDHLMNIRKNRKFFQAYNTADYKVCDSQILLFASKFLGTPIKEKVSGSDLFPAFCRYHQQNPDISIFLLGGAEGVAQQAQVNINQKVGRDIVVEAHSPSYGFEKNDRECLDIVNRINASGATVLAIGVGAPKQEQWVCHYKEMLVNVKIIFAVGATIDFEAGIVGRAPRFISNLGIEWLYRLTSEPKRLWKRYLVNDLPFFWLLIQQKFKII